MRLTALALATLISFATLSTATEYPHLQSNSFYKMLKSQKTDLDLSLIEPYLNEPILYIKEPFEHHEIVAKLYLFIQEAVKQKPFVAELCKELLYQIDSKEIRTQDGLYVSKLYLDEVMTYFAHPNKQVEIKIEKVKTLSDFHSIQPIFKKSFRCKELYENAALNEEMKAFLKTKDAKNAQKNQESLEELFYSQRKEFQKPIPSWDLFFSFVQEKALSKSTDIYVAKSKASNTPLGFLWINKEYGHIYMVSYLAKDPQAVNLGIGKKLLMHLKEIDPHKYILQVVPENESALSLYKSVGFTKHKSNVKKSRRQPSNMIQMIADFRTKEKKDALAFQFD